MSQRKAQPRTSDRGRLTGPATGSSLHSVQTVDPHPPVRTTADRWGRRRVLLLNSTYEPLAALPVRRAVIMLLCGKADVVHADPAGPVIHSATRAIVLPSVIRLRSFVRVPYRARVPMTRAALMHRDRFRCAYCGSKADTVDHVVPRSRGGDHSWENCVAAARPAITARPTGCSPSWAGRCGRPRAAEGAALATAVLGQGARPGLGAIPR